MSIYCAHLPTFSQTHILILIMGYGSLLLSAKGPPGKLWICVMNQITLILRIKGVLWEWLKKTLTFRFIVESCHLIFCCPFCFQWGMQQNLAIQLLGTWILGMSCSYKLIVFPSYNYVKTVTCIYKGWQKGWCVQYSTKYCSNTSLAGWRLSRVLLL